MSSIFFNNQELKALRTLLNSLDLDTNDTTAEIEDCEYEEEDDLEVFTIFITDNYKTPFPCEGHPELTVIASTRIYTLDDDGKEFVTSGSETHSRNY